jgi:hypothetical protein
MSVDLAAVGEFTEPMFIDGVAPGVNVSGVGAPDEELGVLLLSGAAGCSESWLTRNGES